MGDVLVWDGSNWVPDNNLITINDSNVVMDNSFSLSDGFFLAYSPTSYCPYVNVQCYIEVYPDATAPNRIVTLPNGETVGQILVLTCSPYAGANGFRLNSTGNLKSNGGSSLDLYQNDTVMLIWNGVSWVEVSRSSN